MFLLEDRILFDAAVAIDISDAANHDDYNEHNEPDHESNQQHNIIDDAALPQSPTDANNAPAPLINPHIDAVVRDALDGNLAALGLDGNFALPATDNNVQTQVLLIADSLANADELYDSAGDNTIAIRYDAANTTTEQLLEQIEQSLDGEKMTRLGIAQQSDSNGKIDLLTNDSDTELWQGLNDLMANDAAIDLFASDMADSEFTDALATLAGHEVNYSDNLTGSDGDWTLEYGGIDLADTYFDGKLAQNVNFSVLPAAPTHELAIINSSVMDVDDILDDLGDNVDVLILDGNSAPLAQINDYLDTHDNIEYDAMHIIAHGNDGYFVLNGCIVDGDYATDNADDFAAIGEHLTADGDIMLYGCDLTTNSEGQALVAQLADLTGADVAASNDTTANIGGDWNLEYSVGLIDSSTFSVEGYNYHLTDWSVIVNSGNGVGTLRDIVDNHAVAGDSISFNINGTDTVDIGTTDIDLTVALAINGHNNGTGIDGIAGDSNVTLQVTTPGVTQARVFDVNAVGSTVNISDMAIKGGNITSLVYPENFGGGIRLQGGTLNLSSVTISDGSAGFGGGIAVYASSTAVDLNIIGSTITGNSAGSGGAIINYALSTTSHIVIEKTTINNNSALSGDGGAIYNYARNAGANALLNITNSTISNNSAAVNGGGIFSQAALSSSIATVNLNHTTITGNIAGTNGAGISNSIYSGTTTLNLNNSIVAYNYKSDMSGYTDIYNDASISGDYNIVGNLLVGANSTNYSYNSGKGASLFDNYNEIVANTIYQPNLDDNGGDNDTVMLAADSIAIDAGNHANAIIDEQRGYLRLSGIDIGAVQYDGTIIAQIGDYITVNDGADWNSVSNQWYSYNGFNWIAATIAPTSIVNNIYVRHNINVASALNIDQTTVTNSGHLTVNSGQILGIANGIDTDLTVNNYLTITGQMQLLAGATADLLSGDSTVTYNGGSQAILPLEYATLAVTGNGSTKNFAAGVTSVAHQIVLNDDITLTGASLDTTTLQVTNPGVTVSRLFYINAPGATINIANMTIAGGNLAAIGVYDYGGVLLMHAGTLNLNNLYITDGKAYYGSGIAVYNDTTSTTAITVNITDSTVSGNGGMNGNFGQGGGIFNYANYGPVTITLANSTVSYNQSGYHGGGIYNYAQTTGSIATIEIIDSTINSNSANYYGGGIFNSNTFGTATVNLTNSTVSNNTATQDGGGICSNAYRNTISVNVMNSTISGNIAGTNGAGVYANMLPYATSSTINLTNTIVAYNYKNDNSTYLDADNANGATIAGDYNIVGDQLVGVNSTNYSYTNGKGATLFDSYTEIAANAIYQPLLANNGGSTSTVALADSSIATSAGTATGAPLLDQRGVPRHNPPAIGAYETVYDLYFRTVSDGMWNDLEHWQFSVDNLNWYSAIESPEDGNSLAVSVEHNIQISADLIIDQATITSSGTLTVNSGQTLIVANGSGTDLIVNNQLTITGELELGTGATADLASGFSSVIYNGAAQSISGLAYYNLNFAGSGDKTLVDDIAITNNLTITGGNFVNNAYMVTFNGSALQNIPDINYFDITLANGNKSAVDLHIAHNMVFSNPLELNVTGSFTIVNDFTAGGGTVNYSGGNQNIAGVDYYNLMLTGSGIKAAGGLIIGIANNFTISGITFAANGQTVRYNGGSQDILGLAYHHLEFTGSGNKTLSGDINIAGDFIINAGTFIHNNHTVTYNGGSQSIAGVAYYDLILSGSGTKELSGDMSIASSFTINGVSFSHNNHAITYNGNSNQTIIELSSNYYDLILAGTGNKSGSNIIVDNDLTFSTTVELSLTGNLSIAGTFAANNGTVNYSGVSQTIADLAYYNLTFSGSYTVTASNINVTNNLTFGSVVELSLTGSLNVGSTFTAGSGTVNYSGTAQAIAALDYYKLKLSGSDSKTLAGDITIGGSLTIFSGNFVHNNHAVIYNGAGQRLANVTYYDVVLAGSGTKSSSNLTVTNNLTFSTTVELSVTGVLDVGGTFTAGSGTINYNGGSQTIIDVNYYNLTLSGIALGIVKSAVNLNIANNLTISSSNITLEISGTLTVSGIFSNGSATVNYNGTGQTITDLNYSHLTIAGSGITQANDIHTNTLFIDNSYLAVSGILDVSNPGSNDWSGNATIDYNGGSQNLTLPYYNNLILSGSGTKTQLANTIYIAGNLTTGGTAIFAANSGMVSFNGINQQVADVNYYNLEIAGSGVKTATDIHTTNLIFSGSSPELSLTGSLNATTMLRATGTINYSGTAQTIVTFDYYNLTISGSGNKTLAGNITIYGNFTASGGSFIHNNHLVSFNGTGSNQNIAGINYYDLAFAGTGNKSLTGDVSIANLFTVSGGTFVHNNHAVTYNGFSQPLIDLNYYDLILDNSTSTADDVNVSHNLTMNNGELSLTGALSVGGTFIAANGTVNFSGTDQNIAPLSYNNMTISGSGNKTLSGNISLTGNFTASGGTFNANSHAVSYNGNIAWAPGVQNIAAVNYYDLLLSGTKTKYAVTNLNVVHDMTISGSTVLSLNGSLTVSGTFTANQSRVEYINGIDQTIAGVNYYDLVLDNQSGSGFGNKILGGDIAVANNFTFTAGNFVHNNYGVDYNGTAQDIAAVNYYNLTFSGSGNKTLAGDIAIAGAFTVNNGTTFVHNNHIVNYNGNSAQSIIDLTYYGLTLSGSGVKTAIDIHAVNMLFDNSSLIIDGTLDFHPTIGTNYWNGIWSINYHASSGIPQYLELPHYHNLTIDGSNNKILTQNITISGTMLDNSNTATFINNSYSVEYNGTFQHIADLDYAGLIVSGTVNDIKTATSIHANYLTFNSAIEVDISGVLDVPILNAGSGKIFYNGDSQTITDLPYYDLDLAYSNSSKTAVNLSVSHDLTISGPNVTLDISGILTVGNSFAHGTSTIKYSGAAQNIIGVDYFSLTLTGSGNKTLAGDIGIAGNFTITGGTFVHNNYTVDFNNNSIAIGNQNIAGGNYNNIIINGVGTKTLTGNIFIAGDCTVNGGTLITNGYNVTYNGSNQTIAAADYNSLILTGANSTKTFATGTSSVVHEIILSDAGMTITGAGSANTTVQVTTPGIGAGATAARVFHTNAGIGNNITIENMTIKGGDISGLTGDASFGGSIFHESGTLTINNALITGSKAVNGGGIYSKATINITVSTVNSAHSTNNGGGLYNSYSTMTLSNTTVANNLADRSGGGVASFKDISTTIENSTISDNDARLFAGVYSYDSNLVLNNSTVANNTATAISGGVGSFKGTISLLNTTISNNTATTAFGAVYNNNSQLYMVNSIVIENPLSGGGTDNSLYTSAGGNSFAFYSWYDGSKVVGALTTNTGAPNLTSPSDGTLSALADNSGSTWTMAVQTGSNIIANGTYIYHNFIDGYYFSDQSGTTFHQLDYNTFTPTFSGGKITTDQRGLTRDPAFIPTMGAYEFNTSMINELPNATEYSTDEFSDLIKVHSATQNEFDVALLKLVG